VGGTRAAAECVKERTRGPHRVRLPGFSPDDDVGLGDLIKRATTALGITPCDGCERRAADLSRWLTFSKRPPL
jgi:hypothetical protein